MHLQTMHGRLRVGWLNGSGRGTTRAEDAEGTPNQSHISPSVLVYKEKPVWGVGSGSGVGAARAPRKGRGSHLLIQGYLAHKKQRPPRTLQ